MIDLSQTSSSDQGTRTAAPTVSLSSFFFGLMLILALTTGCSSTRPVAGGDGFAPGWYDSGQRAQWTADFVSGTGYAVSTDSSEALVLARSAALSSLRSAVHERMEYLRRDEIRAENESGESVLSETLRDPAFLMALRKMVDAMSLESRQEQTSSHKANGMIYHQFVRFQCASSDLQTELQSITGSAGSPALSKLIETLKPAVSSETSP